MEYDFIAIDFETANYNTNSACSIGLVLVKNLEIVDKQHHFIKPPTEYFTNTHVHGITYNDVKNALTFEKLWIDDLSALLSNVNIVAHNAKFDISVLLSCCAEYDITPPTSYYLDSINLFNVAFPNHSKYNLKYCAEVLSISLENHHNALDDAIACAEISIQCINKLKVQPFFEGLASIEKIKPKPISQITVPKTITITSNSRKFARYSELAIAPREISATTDDICKNHTLYGKNIVFTGDFTNITRKEAMQKAVDVGALVKSGVTSKTNYLVVGTQDLSIVTSNCGKSSKELKAIELIEKGIDIKILNEEDFLTLVGETFDPTAKLKRPEAGYFIKTSPIQINTTTIHGVELTDIEVQAFEIIKNILSINGFDSSLVKPYKRAKAYLNFSIKRTDFMKIKTTGYSMWVSFNCHLPQSNDNLGIDPSLVNCNELSYHRTQIKIYSLNQLNDLAKLLCLSYEQAYNLNNTSNKSKIGQISVTPNYVCKNHILYNKNMFFIGDFTNITSKEAMQKAANVGAILKHKTVTTKVDCLIVGNQSLINDTQKLKTFNKELDRAYELIEKGYNIIIIDNEEDFLLLTDEPSSLSNNTKTVNNINLNSVELQTFTLIKYILLFMQKRDADIEIDITLIKPERQTSDYLSFTVGNIEFMRICTITSDMWVSFNCALPKSHNNFEINPSLLSNANEYIHHNKIFISKLNQINELKRMLYISYVISKNQTKYLQILQK